ncbi:MAG: Crp/Fnr family transcriptional regulator [Betaproteobacteria bacterium]|nr:Crp/Fnr family transcriptional regulator [Betaproteobacteria bacterium]
MEDLDFTTQPSESPVYDPVAAMKFFKSAGVSESVAAGTAFFSEHQSRGFFSADERMFLLVQGSVGLTVAGKSLDTVKPGEIFGELATITDSKRAATASAKTDCSVISLDAKQFQKAIAQTPGFALMLMSIMIDRLRLRIAMLSMQKAVPAAIASGDRRVFDDATLNEIAGALGDPPPIRYSAGQTIINAGEPGVRMYLLRKGIVAITANGNTLERVRVGGVFGEMALVDQSTRKASAVAETDCELMAVNRKQFLDLVQSNPAFGLSLLKLLGQRLQAATGAGK